MKKVIPLGEIVPVMIKDEAAVRRVVVEQELKRRFSIAGDGEATRLLCRAALEYLQEKSE